MNILVEFGPVTGVPAAPDATREQQAKDLIALIDPLLWPLEQRAIDPVPTKTATPAAEPAGRPAAPAERGAVTAGRPRASGRSGDEVGDLDKRIIEHLQQDGRRPFTQIAAELGVSEAAVRARTNRLVERGILQVVGVTDPLKLGFQQMAMIGIRCEANRLMDVAERGWRVPRGRLRRHHRWGVRHPDRDGLRGQRGPAPILGGASAHH